MVSNTTASRAGEGERTRNGSSARAARRWFLVIAPAVAGLLAVLGAATDTAVNQDGAALYAQYAAHPGPMQIQALAYHFSYALLGAVALSLAGLLRRRGSWAANVAAILAVLGISTQPGFIIVDFYASAAGQVFGGDASRMDKPLDSMWALGLLAVTGLVGFLLCLPVAALAAWRAGIAPWWGLAGVVVGLLGFMVVGANVPGALVLTVGLLLLSAACARIDRRAWEPADGRAEDAVHPA